MRKIKNKTIKIKCTGAELVPYDSLSKFQGDLKILSTANMEKLKQQILKKGFKMPFYIWKNRNKNKILDGTQRYHVLAQLKNDGYEIPLLPVVYIEAKNETDARETVLAISSQYGEWNKLELETWLEDIGDEIKDTLRFVDKEIKAIVEINFEEDENAESIKRHEKILCACPKCGFEWQK